MICLESIIDGDEIRNLKCSHCFHSKCVDIWLLGTLSDETLNTSICPTCRKEAITNQTSPIVSSADEQENSQDIITPIPIFLPQTLLTNNNNSSNNDMNISENGLSEISSNRSVQSTESQRSYLPQDKDIPREVFMTVGQYLLESGSCIDTPSPLMSPAPFMQPSLQLNHSNDGTIHQQSVISNTQLDIHPRSRSSSFSSISSSQSINSNSSTSSFLSIPNSTSSGSGIYINFSILSNSLDILSIASGE